MRKFSKYINIPFLGFILCPVFLYAQKIDTISSIQLGEIIVNHNINTYKSHHSSAPVQSVSGKKLTRLSSLNVADALRYFTGIQLKDYGGIGGIKTVNVRSMGSQHTGVFYDGIQLGNAQNGQVDLGKFSIENMEEISLYQGQRSQMEQSAKAYASANTIYLETKRPIFAQGKNYELASSVRTGSFGLFNPSLNISYKINDAIAVNLSTERVRAHGRYRFQYSNGIYDTTAVRNNADITSNRLEASVYGKHRNKHRWKLKYYHYDSQRGLPGAIVANRFRRPQRLWNRTDFLQAEYRHEIGENYTLKLLGKFNKDFSRYSDPEIVTTTGLLENKYYQREYYLSLIHTFKVKPYWILSLASDFQYNTMQANLYRFSLPKRNSLLNVLASSWNFDRFNFQASLLSTAVYESVEHYRAADDLQQYSPSFLFNVQPFRSPGFRLRGFYKNIFRLPSFNDLYYTLVGNTFLSPEYSDQINLGFSWKKETSHRMFHLTSDVYRIWITDKIVAVPGTNLFRWTMMNLGEVLTNGLEASLSTSAKVGIDLEYTLMLSYTFQESLDLTPGGNSYGQQIPYIPIHSGSFSIMGGYKRLEVNYSFIYTGERYSQKANISSNFLQPWYTHDLSLNYSLPLSFHQLRIAVEINNLLNQQYAVIKNFPMPGRSFRVGLNYQI